MADTLAECITKWTLKNAADYGLAIPAKVISRVIAEHPEKKTDMKGLMALISEECKRVNALSKEQAAAGLSAFHFEEKPKEEEGERKITLPGPVPKHVMTRFPPEPSGYLHIGHAKAAFLNFESAKQYGGGMRLRMDDTNPEKESAEFVDAIIRDLKWLGISWADEITYTSDYMERLYEYADEMILKQKAYVCTCPAEEVKKNREKGEQCLCRTKFPEESMHEFRKMMNGKFGEGDAVLRYSGDMKAENTTLRDPTLFRIIHKPHYRQGDKYKCWPSYDFAAPIIDSLEGVSHAMRSKEYELRETLYYHITKILELRPSKLVHFSRLAIAGAPVSKRLITPLIAEGKVSGYDDPRLPTLSALRRRGIRPEAIRAFVLSFGLSKVESEPGWDKLLNENRKLIDPDCPRRFFVRDPVRLEIAVLAPGKIAIKNHPANSSLGMREKFPSNVVYISARDSEPLFEGNEFRLKDWCNVRVKEISQMEYLRPDGSIATGKVIRADYVAMEGEVARKFQWVGENDRLCAQVLIPGDLYIDGKFNPDSLEIAAGWVEKDAAGFEPGQNIQFERFGFVTLDKKEENRLTFILTSQ